MKKNIEMIKILKFSFFLIFATHTIWAQQSSIYTHDLKEFDKQKLIDFIVANPERVIGGIETDLLTEIYNTIRDARTILPILKRKYGFI